MILFLKTMGMGKENFENKTPDILENNYQRYLELGGIINEKDYQSALETAVDSPIFRNLLKDESPLGAELRSHIEQVKNIAGIAGIELHSTKELIDRRVMLYVVLRSGPFKNRNTDQRVFMEALRMLGDVDSRDKMIKAYPNISFEYEIGK